MRALYALCAAGLMMGQAAPAVSAEETTATSVGRTAPIAVGIIVKQPKSHGFCPRPLDVKAALQIQEPNGTAVMLRYRFLENGAPVSEWKALPTTGGDTVHLSHRIQIKEGPGPVRTSKAAVNPVAGQIGLGDASGVIPKSTVGIEVRSRDLVVSDAALYEATCSDTDVAALQPAQGIDLPDLTATGGIKLGGTFVRWGDSAVLGAGDIIADGPLGCTVRFAFNVANTGAGPAPGHGARLQRGARTLAVLQTPPLRAERTRRLGGQIQVPAGQSLLRLRIDDTKLVKETSEANNLFNVRVTAPARCGTAVPGRP